MAQAATPTITQNILRDGLILPRTPDPAAMVIFGASGDLTARKFFYVIIDGLGASGIAKAGEGWKRVVIEKPFGNDLKSSQALNYAIHMVFSEPQIYRIDHYLGKETVQNVLVFRFANGIFEPIWNRRYVDHVQITVAEDIGIERRGKYYETAGALRDIFQNHLLQLLSIAAMEAPPNFDADSVRDEKV